MKFSKLVSLSLLVAFTLSAAAHAEDKLRCADYIDLSQAKGQTFLNFMKTRVKPALDRKATTGYKLLGRESVRNAAKFVDTKIQERIEKWGGVEYVALLSDIHVGTTVNLYTLPKFLDYEYDMATFIGLASCGGVTVKIDENNWYYNIHYGPGKFYKGYELPQTDDEGVAIAPDHSKDDRTGRSFGAGPGRYANDASDKNYLNDLEEVARTQDPTPLFETLMQAITNSDVSGYAKLSDKAQVVATDFLAVYTAEQDRNLMDGHVERHWDAALAEVTFLAAFHSGQKQLLTMVDGQLRSVVPKQHLAGEDEGTKQAQLNDYWQFSRNFETKEDKKTGKLVMDPLTGKAKLFPVRRSGINITKNDFRGLARAITRWENKRNPHLVRAIENALKAYPSAYAKPSDNVFEDVMDFLISDKRPASLGYQATELTRSFVAFLAQVRRDADAITLAIQTDPSLTKKSFEKKSFKKKKYSKKKYH